MGPDREREACSPLKTKVRAHDMSEVQQFSTILITVFDEFRLRRKFQSNGGRVQRKGEQSGK